MLLSGKVDRADVWRTKNGNYISIVDYKSGGKNIDYSEVLCGIQIQLPTYISAVCEALSCKEGVKAMPAAMLYYKFDSPVVAAERNISDKEVWEAVQKKLKMQGITLDGEEAQEGINTLFVVKSPATAAQIDKVCSVAHKQLVKAFKGILRGNISINPARFSGYTACDSCPYSSICLFDTSLQDNKYRNIKKVNKEEFFNHVDKMDE